MADQEEFEIPKDVQQYMRESRIVIVDGSRASRGAIFNAANSMGTPSYNLVAIKKYTEAEEVILRIKPNIIISEYYIDEHFGLDLLELQKRTIPNPEEKIFMIVTASSEESIISEAAEEDVDTILLKPFTRELLFKYLTKAVLLKLHPSPYRRTINRGKEFLQESDLVNAGKQFVDAKGMDKRPALACYYTGVTEGGLKNSEASLKEYEAGLEYNPIHYKCLVGKLEALEEGNKKTEAYDVIQTLLKYFPVSPQRLGNIFRLAVHTRNFSDVQVYYEIFQNLDRKSDHLRKIVTSGLVVCGKFLLAGTDKAQALDLLREAITTSKLQPHCFEVVIETLLNANLPHDALKLFEMWPLEARNDVRFKILNFKISAKRQSPELALTLGLKYIDDGVLDPFLYEEVIRLMIELKRENTAEALAYKAIDLFPEYKNRFQAFT